MISWIENLMLLQKSLRKLAQLYTWRHGYNFNNRNMEHKIMEWLQMNWEWVLLGFMILEKLVKMSPSDKDDILLDVIVQGLTKMVKGEKK